MLPNPQFPADLVTFTVEILNGKHHFLCSGKWIENYWALWPSTAQNVALNLLNKKETAVSSTTFRRNHLPNDKSQPDNTNFKLCKENEILICL